MSRFADDTRGTIAPSGSVAALRSSLLRAPKPQAAAIRRAQRGTAEHAPVLPSGLARGSLRLNRHAGHPGHAHPSVPAAIDISRDFRANALV